MHTFYIVPVIFFFQFFVSVLAVWHCLYFLTLQQIRWSKSSDHANSSKIYEFSYALPVNVYALCVRQNHEMPINLHFSHLTEQTDPIH